KRHLIVYIAIATLAIATPELDGRADAQDGGGYYFVIDGRIALSGSDTSVYAEREVSGGPERIDTELGGGGRIGFGINRGAWDFGIFYTGLSLSGDQTINDQHGNHLYPVLGYSYTGYDNTYSQSDVTYHVLDFQAGYNMKLGQTDVRLFGGVRYANLDQQVDTTFYTLGSTPYNMDERRDVQFWGLGFRVGANAQTNISGPFGLFGSASSSVLFGQQNTATTQNQTIGVPAIVYTRASRSEGRVAGNLDAEIGGTYTLEMANASKIVFAFGYRAEAWFGVNNTQSEPPTNSGTIYGTMHADQIFHGPFLRGEWQFD
ncbi:MAG: Lpg1974 family pore-forming outer membrane protein, partial [Nitrospinales bacterium]